MELRTEVYATSYASKHCFPPNAYLEPDCNQEDYEAKWALYHETVERLEQGAVIRP